MTESGRGKPPIIRPLTGVRGFAAIWVVLYHLRPLLAEAFPGWKVFNDVVQAGYLGVDLFAFLSGFIIAHTYSQRLRSPSWPAFRRYLWLRFVRTYPLHLFVLALFVLMSVYRLGDDAWAALASDGSFWRQLFLLNGLGLEDRWAWNVPSWSLSSEWACYLLFPAAAPVLIRVSNGWVSALFAVATLAATILGLGFVGHSDFHAYLDWGALRIGGEFFTGCWLYRVHASGLLAGRGTGWGGLLAITLALCGLLLFDSVAVTIVAFAGLILALAHDEPPLRVLFGNRVSLYLGEISYSLYILHWLFVANRDLFAPERFSIHFQLVLLLWWVFVGSAFSYHFVEQSTRRRLRNVGVHPHSGLE